MDVEELLYISVLGKQKCWGRIECSIQTSSTLTALSSPICLSHCTASGFSLSHVSVDWLANIMLLNMNENIFLRTSVCWLVRHNTSYKRREYEERTFLRDWASKCMGNFDKLLLAKPVNTKIKLSCKAPICDPIIFFLSLCWVSLLQLLRFQSVPTQKRRSVSLFEI